MATWSRIANHDDLVALLERYDEAIIDGPSKTGVGIGHFTPTRNNFNEYSTPSFWVHRTDGTATDFSYISGVNGHAKGYSREQLCARSKRLQLASQ